MKDSPVLKLQEMASSSATDITELLSRAKMISVKLGLDDIAEWLGYELNGYPSYDLLPKYRVLTNLPLRAFNPYVGWIPYQLGDTYDTDKELYDILTTVHINNPISMIIEFVKEDQMMYSDLPANITHYLQQAGNIDFRIAWSINPAQLINIFSNVRTKILDWALQLERKNILGDGLLFSLDEKREAIGMTINNINNFNGNVSNAGAIGAGNNGNINQKNIAKVGDFGSLEQQLREYGIDDKDILDLKNIIDTSPKPISKSNLGENVGGWMGNLIGKAYSGALKITGEAAPVLLTNTLCHYFGIPV
ncbi:abortive phage resistance protein [Providencia rettgeri]|uniref:AbiTii domain-containing protein n=1 Tax=Providencia rettgeri TaxID=587 RepID=UPI00159A6260|nr:abortive phage resistance protein [Providencia rettgeri]MBQ0688055.1 abortive phage resistance protein [Providencia rettgeri]QKJ51467.1 abortive phage resistance protein [Providencia rettgeri]